MVANKAGSSDGYRALEIMFNPWEGRRTTVNVLTVDYRGDRRVARRIGALSLGLGRSDLVGLTPSEVTYTLVEELYRWMSEQRSILALASPRAPVRVATPAPPEGVTGEAVDPLRTDTLPGL